MPIEKTYADAMLGTFRNMLKECQDKQIDSEALNQMTAVMEKMDMLAIEMNDINSFSTKLTTEGLFTDFSLAYAKVLAEEGQKKYGTSGSYDDDALLQQTLIAYEQSLEQTNEHPDKEKLQAPVKAVIELGRSGINYPTFLRLLIEKGLDKAMEGSVLNRNALVQDIRWAVDLILPVYEKRNCAILKKYDEMAAAETFGVPDAVAFSMERFRITSAFQPAINQYQAIADRWMKMLTLLHDWIDAYTSPAPFDSRYAAANQIETQRNIKFYKECNPGFFKVRLDIFKRYFSLDWNDIFSHESFANERKAKRCMYTDEYIDFLKEVYLHCKPFSNAPAALVNEAEQLHNGKLVFIS